MHSPRLNLVATYLSQGYAAVLGILVMPFYLAYLGAEAYGLIGFFGLIQTWFQLLDLGLTPTIARESARLAAGAVKADEVRKLLRALEALFIVGGIAAAIAFHTLAPWLANHWLKVNTLPLDAVSNAISLMGLAGAARWVATLYRGALAGLEDFVWISSLNGLVATARFLLVFPVLHLAGTSVVSFFYYQAVVAIVEATVLALRAYSSLPAAASILSLMPSFHTLANKLKFSLIAASSGAIWIFVTQADKLLLSRLLSLRDFGHATLAVVLAGSVIVISGPLTTVLLPQLTRIYAREGLVGAINAYRNATRMMTLTATMAAAVLVFTAEPVLVAWTGDRALAKEIAPILALYAAGNGILTLSAFPYYLQFAHGNLRLHIAGSVLLILVLFPSVIAITPNYGATGAAACWFIANLCYFLIWVPISHGRFASFLHRDWALIDIAPILLPSLVVLLLSHWLCDFPTDRAGAAIWCIGIGFLGMGTAVPSFYLLQRKCPLVNVSAQG
jgi:O-antigen/teichoic acid export membrane protein